MGWFNKGKEDAQQNRGPINPNQMTPQERDKYGAGQIDGKK